jgi:NADPH:quinone reductase
MGQIPDMMRAVIAEGSGGPEVLKVVQRPVPKPREGEILVKVKAAGVNRPDVIQRQGGYPPPPGAPDILGLEIAGEVAATGPNAARFAVGTPVMALVPGGGYADYAVVHESNALPIPASLSFEEAGAVPETYFTVWTNVFDRGRLQPGETLLVHGGTSGIGTTAIQLAKAFGATVIATAGSQEKCDACLRLGADVAVNYRNQDFVTATKEATGGRGADVILDMVGGDYVPKELKCLADEGRLVFIAFLRGHKTELDINEVMRRRLTISGSTLRPRPVEFKGRIAARLRERIWPLIEAGRIRPQIFRSFPLEQAGEAHRLMESSQHIGKLVLTV